MWVNMSHSHYSVSMTSDHNEHIYCVTQLYFFFVISLFVCFFCNFSTHLYACTVIPEVLNVTSQVRETYSRLFQHDVRSVRHDATRK